MSAETDVCTHTCRGVRACPFSSRLRREVDSAKRVTEGEKNPHELNGTTQRLFPTFVGAIHESPAQSAEIVGANRLYKSLKKCETYGRSKNGISERNG